MTVLENTAADDRLLPSGDEAGTAPGDRRFRPDVQGLRAVAILLVILFHADVPGFRGGYVGVDVFFVISGFVITGLLLRESASTGRTSLRAFYSRRLRRIIPAATLVIGVTVLASAFLLSPAEVHQNAIDGIWTSVFLANFHFVASSTNYLASQQFPSALQNFWSLAVEEQFYLVYPGIFLLVALVPFRSLRWRLSWLLGLTVLGSFILSVTLTSSNAAAAYFLPFTRAWELAAGALVAVLSQHLVRIPLRVATAMTWFGFAFVVLAACVYSPSTPYPGSAAALPVFGTALVIAGGTSQPRYGAEALLRRRPFQLLGLISYSLYLWHWPILTIAAQRRGVTSLPVADNLLWLLLALALAIGTYLLLENPVRHAKALVNRRWASIVLGGCLIASSAGLSAAVASQQHLSFANELQFLSAGSRCPSPAPSQVASLRHSYVRSGGSNSIPAVQTRIAVMGDSTACTLIPALQAVAPSFGARIENGAVTGCGIVSDQTAPVYLEGVNLTERTNTCQGKVTAAESPILGHGHPSIIIWDSEFERSSITVNTAQGPVVLQAWTPRWTSVMLARINRRLGQFISTGAKVVVMLEPPFVNAGGPTRPTTSDRSFERLNRMLTSVARNHPSDVTTVNLATLVCPAGPPCPFTVSGLIPRPDGDHYGTAGSLWVAAWLLPRILAAAQAVGH